MELKILSHACLLVKAGGHSVIIDPWLLGSCYWRSWWNFPEPVFDEAELADVDAVVISHVHWDHWHGPTLKRFFKGKRIIVPDEPGQRSRRDLAAVGFKKIDAVPHGQSVNVGPIKLTLYQFGLFLNDAAIVVEADGVALLDANDAKIAGAVLSDIVKRHGPFTFALRSHSSANPRVRFSVANDPEYVVDEREHYFRAFRLFMESVKPRYAIPFASNHCHLHDDVFNLNSYVSNPVELKAYLDKQPRLGGWEFVLMLPGSSWNSQAGFTLSNQDAYTDLDKKLAAYRLRIAPTLSAYLEEEEAVKLTSATWKRLTRLWQLVPPSRRPRGEFGFVAYWPSGREQTMVLDGATGELAESDIHHAVEGRPVLRFPAIVLRDAVLKNMFHHAGISKRCAFVAANKVDMAQLESAFAQLEKVELGLYPLNKGYLARLLGAYTRRWRELLVYAQAAWYLKVRRLPIYHVEEAILERSR